MRLLFVFILFVFLPVPVFALHNSTITLNAPVGSCSGTASQIQLTWTTSNTHGSTKYVVERKISGGFYADVSPSLSDFSYNDQVVSGTAYVYRIRGTQGGTTIFSSEVPITSEYCGAAISVSPPSCATDGPHISMSWDSASGSVDRYEVERKKEGEASFSFLANAGLDMSYDDGPAIEGTKRYTYRIKTVWQDNTSRTSSESPQVTALACPPPNVAVVSKCLTDTGPGGPRITIAWNPLLGVQEYEVYRDAPGDPLRRLAGGLATSYNDDLVNSLPAGYFGAGNISYYVKAVWPNTEFADSDPPKDIAIPQCAPFLKVNPSCANVLNPKFDLSWTATQGASHFNIYRNGTFTGIQTTFTTFSDPAVDGTTNTYRIDGIAGVTLSSNQVAKTIDCNLSVPAPPPVLNAPVAHCVNLDSQVDLSWSSSDNVSYYNLYRQTSSKTDIFQVTNTFYADDEVQSGVSYMYYVTATGPGGSTAIAQANTHTIPAVSCAAPSKPSNVSLATQCLAGGPGITVSWTSDDFNTSSYMVRRSDDGGSTFPVIIGTFGKTDPKSVLDTSVGVSTAYYYKVVAEGPAGIPPVESSVASITSSSCVPATPTLTLANECSGGLPRVNIAWSSSGTNVQQYELFRNATFLAPIETDVTGGTRTDTAVSPLTSYSYQVDAVGPTGLRSSKTASIATNNCAPAGGFVIAEPITLSCVGPYLETTVSWGPSANATSYNLFRKQVSTGGVVTHSGATSPFLDTGFGDAISSIPEQYTWQAEAVAPGGNALSPITSPADAPICAPSKPAITSLAAYCAAGSSFPVSIDIKWSDTINTTQYKIYRNTTGAGPSDPGDLIATVSGTTFAFTDTNGGIGLEEEKTYYYWVKAIGPTGLATISDSKPVITPLCIPPTVPQNLAVAFECAGAGNTSPPRARVSWDDSNFASYYQVYRDGVPLDPQIGDTNPSFPNSTRYTSFVDPGIAVGASYVYSVAAFGPGGRSPGPDPTITLNPASNPDGNYCKPPQPVLSPVSAWCAGGKPLNTLSWSGDPTPGNTASYEIYRNTANSRPLTPLAVIPSVLTWQDNGAISPLDASITYYYWVKAVGAGPTVLKSADSSSQSVQTLACGVVPGTPAISVTANQCVAGIPQITLDWADTTNAMSYDVYRTNPSVVYSTRTHPFVDSGSHAVELDATGDRISIVHPTAFDTLRSYTVSFWMNPDSAGPANVGRMLQTLNGVSGEERSIEISFAGGPNTIRLSEGRWDSKGRWSYTHPTSFVGQWTHVAIVYDGNSLSNDPVFYINGSPVAAVETTAPGGSWFNGNPDRLVIGNRFDLSSAERQFDGKLDEMRIYNRALTDGELISGNVSPYGLVGMWHFDEGSGTGAKDDSGNGYNGVLQNETKWVELSSTDSTYVSDPLEDGLEYTYRVRAIGVDTESGDSNLATETAASCVPANPNLQIFDDCSSGSGLKLAWDADPGGNTNSWEVSRTPSFDLPPPSLIIKNASDPRNYLDTDVGSGATYAYTIKAIGDTSSITSTVSKEAPFCSNPPYNGIGSDIDVQTTPWCSGIEPTTKVQWNLDLSGNTVLFNLLREDVTAGMASSSVFSGIPSNITGVTDSTGGLIAGNEYIYWVEAKGSDPGSIVYDDSIPQKANNCLNTPPQPPDLSLNLVFSSGDKREVSISWTDASNEYDTPETDPNFPAEAGYRVLRDGSPIVLIKEKEGGDAAVYSHVDNAVEDDHTYFYEVRAYNANTTPYTSLAPCVDGAAGGIYSNCLEVTVPIARPGTFGMLGKVITGGKVEITWDQAASTPAGGNVTYQVYRAATKVALEVAGGTLICEVPDTDRVDPDVVPLICTDNNPDPLESWYRVFATNAGGKEKADEAKQVLIALFPGVWREISPF